MKKTNDDQTSPSGATPGQDLSGLIDLALGDERARNAAELQSILDAYDKYVYKLRKKKIPKNWLTEKLIREVHFDMFGEVWDWAGKYRQTNLNIGIEWHAVPGEIQKLCGDYSYWMETSPLMPIIEVAARIQNRLTRIHPFLNGNGRHARLITDMVFKRHHHKLPAWPQIQRLPQGAVIRDRYIAAMKKADTEDYRELIGFISDCLDGKI